MKKSGIHLISFGDPKDPRTFSGTVNAIYQELVRRDALCAATDIYPYPPGKLRYWLLNRFSKWYYGQCYFDFKGRWHRRARGRLALKAVQESGAPNALHILSLHLPLVDPDSNRGHYLYIDSTWDSWSKYTMERQYYPPRLDADIDRCERESFQSVTHIFTTAEYLKDNVVTHYGVSPEKVTAVGTGRGGIKPFYGAKDYASKTILFVAKVRFNEKGRQLVLDAFTLAQQRDPSLKLIVAGDDDFHRNAPPIPGLHTHGFINLEQLQSLFEQASLFVMPAINEPWGLVYLEALSCRVPIVGLSRNSIPEFVQNGRHGFALEQGDAEELAQAMTQAFADPARLEKMGSDGQQFVLERYTWEKTVGRMLEVIDNLGEQKC